MRLFVIRHGESECNFNKRYSGQCNPKLTERGEKQAESIRPVLKNIKFDAVYSSDLIRAMQTCKIALPDSKPIVTKLVREIAIGELEDQPVYVPKSENDEFAIELRKNRLAFDYSPYGGESAEDVKKRIVEFLKELEGKNYENVALFCHAGFTTILLSYVLGAQVDREAISLPNCAVNVFENVNDKWSLLVWNYGGEFGEVSE